MPLLGMGCEYRDIPLWALVAPCVRKMQALDHMPLVFSCDPLRCQVATEFLSDASMASGDMLALRNKFLSRPFCLYNPGCLP